MSRGDRCRTNSQVKSVLPARGTRTQLQVIGTLPAGPLAERLGAQIVAEDADGFTISFTSPPRRRLAQLLREIREQGSETLVFGAGD